jgi:hypothetical protein
MPMAFDDDAEGARTDRLARVALAAIDGAIVASPVEAILTSGGFSSRGRPR